ncbi:MAG: hypothetical protein ACK5QS_15880 [Pseudanabaenaceae cyanobacterium]
MTNSDSSNHDPGSHHPNVPADAVLALVVNITEIPYAIVLQGLADWLARGIVISLDYQWRAPTPNTQGSQDHPNPPDGKTDPVPSQLKISIHRDQNLFNALESWLDLGLLSVATVQEILQPQQDLVPPLPNFLLPATDLPVVNLPNTTAATEEFTGAVTEEVIPDQVSLPTSFPVPAAPLGRSPQITESPEKEPEKAKTPARQPRKSPLLSPVTNRVSQVNAAWQALFSELSTMWLLFLGVFLVVISSGLLAASQWQNFAALGQYLLLFAYSGGFFAASFWTSRDQRLRLTSRALQLVTLLLIPINFWAMDGLGLLSSGGGILTVLGCGSILSLMAAFLWQTSLQYGLNQNRSSQNDSNQNASNQGTEEKRLGGFGLGQKFLDKFLEQRLDQITSLTIPLLSWLHLGWNASGWGIKSYGLIAMDLGILVVVGAVLIRRRQRLNSADVSTFPLAIVATTYGGLLLVVRALWFAGISAADFGSALGVLGWVMVQGRYGRANVPRATSTQPESNPSNGFPNNDLAPSGTNLEFNLGQVFLGIGWILGLGVSSPWQSLLVGSLVINLLWAELQQKLKPVTFYYLFFWGLHLLWLIQRVIPEVWQIDSRRQLMAFFQTDQMAALLGVGLFPYVIGTLLVGQLCQLNRRQTSYGKSEPQAIAAAITIINRTGEKLALGLGGILTAMSLFSPVTLCLNLTMSGLTLLVVQAHKPVAPHDPQTKVLPEWLQLIYGTHIVLLGAVGTGIFLIMRLLRLPLTNSVMTNSAALSTGVMILVGLTVVEWSAVAIASYGLRHHEPERHLRLREWIDSAWFMGLGLAAMSYQLFYGATAINTQATLIWLAVPIGAMGLGYVSNPSPKDHSKDHGAGFSYFPGYFRRQRWATKISVIATLLVQPLLWRVPQTQTVLNIPPVVWGLFISGIVMALNTHKVRHGFNSWLTIGFGLFWSQILVLWLVHDNAITEANQLTASITVTVIFVLGLQGLHHWWLRQDHKIVLAAALEPAGLIGNTWDHYRRSGDIWTGIITFWALITHLYLIILGSLSYRGALANSHLTDGTLAITLITGGLVYRTVQKRWALAEWGIGAGVGLTIAALTVIAGGDFLELGAGQVVLGLVSQWAGDWWVKRQSAKNQPPNQALNYPAAYPGNYPATWHWLPLVYSLVGITLSSSSFWDGHGLITLGAAAVMMAVGRRIRILPSSSLAVNTAANADDSDYSPRSDGNFKFLTYVGMVGFTYSLYVILGQYVFRQILSQYWGDALIWLAVLAVTLAYGYRLGTRWVERFLRISPNAVTLFAHLHWCGGLVFLGLAGLFTFSGIGYGIGFIVALALVVYGSSRGLAPEFFPWLSKFGLGRSSHNKSGLNKSAWNKSGLNKWELSQPNTNPDTSLDTSLDNDFSLAAPVVVSGVNRFFDQLTTLIAIGLLTITTVLTVIVFQPNRSFDIGSFTQPLSVVLYLGHLLPITVLITLGLVYRTCYKGQADSPQTTPFWQEWGIAWGIELVTSGVVLFTNGSAIELAIANIALGFGSQLLGDWWIARTGQTTYPLSWHLIPLVYGGMGSLLRWGMAADFSGLLSLSTALIGIGVGRRSQGVQLLLRLLTYLSMAGVTFAAYELLYYQLIDDVAGRNFSSLLLGSSSMGSSVNFNTYGGDSLILLGALGCGLAYLSQWCQRWLMHYLKLSNHELNISAHLHWLMGVGLVLNASGLSHRLGITAKLQLSRGGGTVAVVVLVALGIYSLIQARIPSLRETLASHPATTAASSEPVPLEMPLEIKVDLSNCLWIWSGVGLGLSAVGYWLWFATANYGLINTVILPYGAALICGISVLLYVLPWHRWGWFSLPWDLSAAALPLVMIGLTMGQITNVTIGLVGIFYGVYAYFQGQVRITYITLLLWNWALLDKTFFNQGQNLGGLTSVIHQSPLAYVGVIIASGLYITHVERICQKSRNLRHFCRLVLIGVFCATGFIIALHSVPHAVVMWGLSSLLVVLGLAARIRAYLIIGTVTFVALVMVQAVILVTQYAFLLWVMGILAGIGFIFVAANFESRREFIWGLMRHVLDELDQWQ